MLEACITCRYAKPTGRSVCHVPVFACHVHTKRVHDIATPTTHKCCRYVPYLYHMTCVQCGAKFITHHKRSYFCSDKCRWTAKDVREKIRDAAVARGESVEQDGAREERLYGYTQEQIEKAKTKPKYLSATRWRMELRRRRAGYSGDWAIPV